MRRIISSIFAVAIMLSTSIAYALSLEEAKQQGLVGEQPDGYLGVVKQSADAQAVVKEINEKRRDAYQQIAKKNGTPVATVEALAGQKAIEKTEAGQYVKTAGSWVKK